jgi:import inner membrane translocase subunit TIM17
MEREPCPGRIVNDLGGAFAMGAVTGAGWYAFKGARSAPRGDRLIGSLMMVKRRAPILGGNFAVWGGLFSTFDCAIAHATGKEGMVSAVASGAITGAVLAARSGKSAMIRSGVVGGVLLFLIEGVAHLMGRMMDPNQHMPVVKEEGRAADQAGHSPLGNMRPHAQ